MKQKIKKSKKLGLSALALTTVATPAIFLTSCGLDAAGNKPSIKAVDQASLRKQYIQKVSNVTDTTAETWVASSTPTEITWTLKKSKTGEVGETIVVPVKKQEVVVATPQTTDSTSTQAQKETIAWTDATSKAKFVTPWTDATTAAKFVTPWTDATTPAKFVTPWTELQTPNKVAWTSLNASKRIVKWTDLSASTQASNVNITVPSDWLHVQAADVSTVAKNNTESSFESSPAAEEHFASQNTQPGQRPSAALDLSNVPNEEIAWTDVNVNTNVKHVAWTDLTPSSKTVAWTDLNPASYAAAVQTNTVQIVQEEEQIILELPKRIVEAASQSPVSVVWANGADNASSADNDQVSGLSVLMPSSNDSAIDTSSDVSDRSSNGRISVANNIQKRINLLEISESTEQDRAKLAVLRAVKEVVGQTETAIDEVSASIGTYDWAKYTEEEKAKQEAMLKPTETVDQAQSTSNVSQTGDVVDQTQPTSNVSQTGDIEITNIPVQTDTTVAEVLNPPKEEIAWTNINTGTNVQHTAWTDVNPYTNVQHTAWTDINTATNVKPASIYVGKKMPVSGAEMVLADQYKANYAGTDLFGQQLVRMGRTFTRQNLKGLYLGFSGIKPDPNEFYTKGEEWFADVDAIVAEMNKESDITWHAIGEPYVDALNAVRYTIKKSAQGDSHLVPHLRNIVEKMWWDRGLKAKTTVRGSDFTSNATVDINDWLLGKTQIPVIPSDNYAPAWGNPYDNYLNPRHIRVASDLATMKAVRFSEDLQKWSQYRAQQNEWRGSFDDHMVQQTTMEIGQHAGNAKGNLMNPNTKAPVVQAIPAYWAGENYVNFGALDQTNLPYAAQWHKASEMNIYRAICHVLTTLFDETDYSQTGGHRYPMFDPQNDLIGYSMTFEALSGTAIGSNAHFFAAVPFIITEMWNSARYDAPKGRISTFVQDGYDDKFSVVHPYDLLGSGSLSIYYDGSEKQETLDRLFTQK